MTSSSDSNKFGPGAGNGSGRSGVYSRFIPREELNGFSAWKPGSFGDDGSRRPQAAPAPVDAATAARLAAERQAAEQIRVENARIEQLRLSREGGYQDGYRDGLAALEQFKQSFSAQASTQVAALVQRLGGELDALERDIAQRVAGIALDIARQVVRSELNARPEAVVAVAQEALSSLLVSARHIALRLNPADQALVASGCHDLLAVRHVRLVADEQIGRGGCVVESDIGTTDARIDTRWARANAAIGRSTPWVAPAEPVDQAINQPVAAPSPAASAQPDRQSEGHA